MAYTYLLGSIDITDYIAFQYNMEEKKSPVGEDIIKVPQFSIDLYNEDDIFNFYNDNSPFYGDNPSEFNFEIYDDDKLIYSGYIKNVETEPTEYKATLNISNIMNTLLDRTCIYIDSDITPAEAFKLILEYYGLSDYIDYHSYNYSKAKQEALGLYINITYSIDSTTTIAQVLQALANLSGSDVFYTDGKISFVHWQEYDATEVSLKLSSDVISNNIKSYDDTDNIRNQYSYTITISGSDITITDNYYAINSRDRWGERSYSNITLTSSSSISSTSITGLVDVGNERIDRASEPQKYIEFSIINSEFDGKLDLKTIFSFDTDCDVIFGNMVSNQVWEVLELSYKEDAIDVKAIKIG